MLNYKYGIAIVSKSLQNIYKTMYVSSMKTCCRFIKNIDSFTCRTLG